MKRLLWRVIQSFILLLALAVILPLIGVAVECRVLNKVSAEAPPPRSDEAVKFIATLNPYQRLEDQTYLTLPEWYIVYSADEYAQFININPPSQFPYFSAVKQYWTSYYGMCAVTRDRYPFNSGYHLTLVVIGSSFTIENILKGLYENSIGWLTEQVSSAALTEEDAYARQVATEYGTFIHTVPWYEFPFGEKLAGLWRETSWWGPNMLRKWERKLGLTLEYGIKTGYGWFIKQGNSATYEPESLRIYLWVDNLSEELLQNEPDIEVIKRFSAQEAIISVTRYQAFTELMPRLAQAGLHFVEIAGNDEILVTVIAPSAWPARLTAGDIVLRMPIMIDPNFNRVALKVPVQALHGVLLELVQSKIQVEHIYDY